MKKRIVIFTLIFLMAVSILAVIPKIGWSTGGYSPEELERQVISSAESGSGVKLSNIKYHSVFWWPFTKTFYNKNVSSQVMLAFAICLPYWIVVSLFFALIIEGINQLFIKLRMRN